MAKRMIISGTIIHHRLAPHELQLENRASLSPGGDYDARMALDPARKPLTPRSTTLNPQPLDRQKHTHCHGEKARRYGPGQAVVECARASGRTAALAQQLAAAHRQLRLRHRHRQLEGAAPRGEVHAREPRPRPPYLRKKKVESFPCLFSFSFSTSIYN